MATEHKWNYSAKSGYLTAVKNQTTLDTESQLLELEWTKKVWPAPCIPKIKIFAWKLCQGALPLGANLEKGDLEPMLDALDVESEKQLNT